MSWSAIVTTYPLKGLKQHQDGSFEPIYNTMVTGDDVRYQHVWSAQNLANQLQAAIDYRASVAAAAGYPSGTPAPVVSLKQHTGGNDYVSSVHDLQNTRYRVHSPSYRRVGQSNVYTGQNSTIDLPILSPTQLIVGGVIIGVVVVVGAVLVSTVALPDLFMAATICGAFLIVGALTPQSVHTQQPVNVNSTPITHDPIILNPLPIEQLIPDTTNPVDQMSPPNYIPVDQTGGAYGPNPQGLRLGDIDPSAYA